MLGAKVLRPAEYGRVGILDSILGFPEGTPKAFQKKSPFFGKQLNPGAAALRTHHTAMPDFVVRRLL